MSDLSKDEMKTAFKQAIKEWMDERFAEFGRYTAKAFAIAVFGALVYFMLWIEGYHK